MELMSRSLVTPHKGGSADIYTYIYIYILVLTCSFNEQGSCGTFCLMVGRGVDVAGMYVENVLSVFCQ